MKKIGSPETSFLNEFVPRNTLKEERIQALRSCRCDKIQLNFLGNTAASRHKDFPTFQGLTVPTFRVLMMTRCPAFKNQQVLLLQPGDLESPCLPAVEF
jgi:hypothetical protein